MFDLSNGTAVLLITSLGGLAFMTVVYVLVAPYLSDDRQATSRIAAATETRATRVARRTQAEQVQSRRRAVTETLKELEQREKTRNKKLNMRIRLAQAGLDIPERTFWIMGAVAGLMLALFTFVLLPTSPLPVFFIVFFVGTFGLPRWYLSMVIKRRQKRFSDEFADALDVIVRGVKSGLPFNECLGVIARDTPEPVRSVFREVVEQQRVGVTLTDALDRAIEQMPLSELKFFSIVVGIQQQAGGNLSEALSNLSAVIRSRKQLLAKVKALSAEAKASAMVLGSMPFLVAAMLYLSSPAYILILVNAKFGQFLLIGSAVWMTIGILAMRKMINFKI